MSVPKLLERVIHSFKEHLINYVEITNLHWILMKLFPINTAVPAVLRGSGSEIRYFFTPGSGIRIRDFCGKIGSNLVQNFRVSITALFWNWANDTVPIYLTLPKITARNDSSLFLLHYSLEKTVKTGIVGYVVVRQSPQIWTCSGPAGCAWCQSRNSCSLSWGVCFAVRSGLPQRLLSKIILVYAYFTILGNNKQQDNVRRT
jgi:hypothetical protein